ncbi:Mg-dependent DNase [Sistotremastrum niveocremeum HHB9708]|uniref:Mg-dependent DNase n=1 Tax=Sistotremastrum niveocremeum HHB9708 TaxID=1314777 RepID=A0A164X9F3_9AGAM|nr:Mg-dependent DNase [Sistotremastrum niveocremeum HHB9708]
MTSTTIATARAPRFIVNLTDPVFKGRYRGHKKHADDFKFVLERSRKAGVRSMIITGGSLHESELALKLAKENGLYATVGCHPTRSEEFAKYKDGPDGYLNALDELIGNTGKGVAVAIGECGLDYDRLHFAPKETQKVRFRSQLSLAKKYHLPLFLHSRAAHEDFVNILREEGFADNGGRGAGAKGGVVHSFTGTVEEIKEVNSVNGCSMKTEENLNACKAIPLDKLLLETDAPWCSMTSTQASAKILASLPLTSRALYLPQAYKPESFVEGSPVKGRNEPSAIGGVAWVISQLHGLPFEEVVERAWKNTVELFGLEELDTESIGDGDVTVANPS